MIKVLLFIIIIIIIIKKNVCCVFPIFKFATMRHGTILFKKRIAFLIGIYGTQHSYHIPAYISLGL